MILLVIVSSINQSINKLFFLDGVYDFTQLNSETQQYGVFREENDQDLTPLRLNKNFPHLCQSLDPDDLSGYTQQDVDRVNQVLLSIFSQEPTKQTFLEHLARGIAGCYLDKIWSIICGARNSGKGVITDMLIASFGEYVGLFDYNNLLYKKGLGSDEARIKSWLLPMRWCRLIFGNEQNPSVDGEDNNAKMNGVILKSLASGGDAQIARGLYKEPISFAFGGRPFICVNEIPKVVPSDTCESMVLFTLHNKFVDSLTDLTEAELTFMKLKNPEIKHEIKKPNFSNAFIHVILHAYQNHAVANCEVIMNQNIEHRLDQGDDYLFFKTNFEITNQSCDSMTSTELNEFIVFKQHHISDKRIKQILVDQYGLKRNTNIIYKDKPHRGYIGIKMKPIIRTEFESNKTHP